MDIPQALMQETSVAKAALGPFLAPTPRAKHCGILLHAILRAPAHPPFPISLFCCPERLTSANRRPAISCEAMVLY